LDSHADPGAKIEIFNEKARELAVCHVFAAIKTADSSAIGVSIYDVSARKPGFIAVAAVYSRTSGSPIALLFILIGTDHLRVELFSMIVRKFNC
jgi:hypothetical protein